MSRSITSVLAVVGAGLALSAGSAVAATSSTASDGGSAAKAAKTSKSSAIGPQKTWTRKTAPVDIPSTGIRRGDRLPKGSVLVYRTVDVPKREKRRVRLVVPKGEKLVTVAQQGAFGSGVIGESYVGKRSVTIRVVGGRDGAEGRLYAYAR
jgi:hypothetical protein